MGQYSALLESMTPKTGRLIKEDGTIVNVADNSTTTLDTSTNSLRVSNLVPVFSQHVEETVAAVTNETDGTNYYYLDMDGYSGLNLQLIISGGSGTMTVTVEATLQDDGTAAASCTYVDITNDVFGSASFTSSTILFDDAKILGGSKYVRIKTVSSTGGANDADITIYAKRLY